MAKATRGAAAKPAPVTNWRYVGDLERVYTVVPVTVRRGDVIAWPCMPAEDGNWEPTADAVNKEPDNYRPEEASNG